MRREWEDRGEGKAEQSRTHREKNWGGGGESDARTEGCVRSLNPRGKKAAIKERVGVRRKDRGAEGGETKRGKEEGGEGACHPLDTGLGSFVNCLPNTLLLAPSHQQSFEGL